MFKESRLHLSVGLSLHGLIFLNCPYTRASPVAQTVKNPPAVWTPGLDPWICKIPWRRAWQPTPVFLLGESLWAEELGGLQSMGLQRVRHDWATKHSTVVAWATQAQHIQNKIKPYDLLPQHAKAAPRFPEPLNKYIFRAFLCTMYHSRHWATEVNDTDEFSALMGKTTGLYNC